MRVAIIGATGDSGRHFLDLALDQNMSIRALARTPSKLDDVSNHIEIIQADGRDLESLIQALKPGFDAVVSIVGASSIMESRQVQDLYSDCTRNLIAAMNATDNTRLIVVSSSGVEPQENDGWFYVNILKRFFLQNMYDDMLRMEALLKKSDLDYTIVRPPYLTRGKPTGEYRVCVGSNFTDDKSLRRGDLAHFLIQAVTHEEQYAQTTVALSD